MGAGGLERGGLFRAVVVGPSWEQISHTLWPHPHEEEELRPREPKMQRRWRRYPQIGSWSLTNPASGPTYPEPQPCP